MVFLILLASFETEHEARATMVNAVIKLQNADLDFIKLFFADRMQCASALYRQLFNYDAKARDGSYIIISIPYTIAISIV